jgi:hypothetical protein
VPDDSARSKQFLETARSNRSALKKDPRVDELRLKLGIRSCEYLKAHEPTHPVRIDRWIWTCSTRTYCARVDR